MIAGTIAIRRNEPVFIMGYALAVVPTDSMVGDNPDSLNKNDLVIIKRVNIDDIVVDSHPVIVYQGYGNNGADILIIHRVVGVDSEGLITQGDNPDTNPETDQDSGLQSYITDENFQGVYVAKITFLKAIASIMIDSRSTIFAVIVVILAIILMTEIIHMIKTVNEKKRLEMAKHHQETMTLLSVRKKEAIKEEIRKEYMANLEQSRDAKL